MSKFSTSTANVNNHRERIQFDKFRIFQLVAAVSMFSREYTVHIFLDVCGISTHYSMIVFLQTNPLLNDNNICKYLVPFKSDSG